MMDENRVFPAFATPILNLTWPDADAVNTELSHVIGQRAATERNQPGAPPTDAWHSNNDLLHWGGPAISELTGWIQYAIEQVGHAIAPQDDSTPRGTLQFFAWASVLGAGNYEPVHDTAAYAWSGIYFANPGDPAPENDLGGVLQLQDPRLGVTSRAGPGDQIGQPILIRPQAGRMLVFPGWLPRMTHPYRGTKPRIAVEFNAHYLAEAAAAPPAPEPAENA